MRSLWIIFILCSLYVYSKTDDVSLRFQSITTEHGLPHNYVHSISQDNKGFLWIGTNYGLARYDGYSFKVFQPNPLKPYSITSKPIGSTFVDSYQNLWMSINSGGINKMDLSNERFTGYFSDKTGKFQIGNDVKQFYEDDEHQLWLTTHIGIFLYNRLTDDFTYLGQNNKLNLKNQPIPKITDDGIGNFWILHGGKIGILDKKTFNILSIDEYTNNKSFIEFGCNSIIKANKGEIWLCTQNHGLVHYDIQQKKTTNYLQDLAGIKDIFKDRNGNLFIFSYTNKLEILIFREYDLQFRNPEIHTINDNPIRNLSIKALDDENGNVCITGGEGLAIYNFNTGFKRIQANTLKSNSISSNFIENIFIDRTNNLWLCTYRSGISKADLNQKPFQIYEANINTIEDILSDKSASSVYEDKEGNIWAGISNHGVSIYNKSKKEWYRFDLEGSDPITSILEDYDGRIWLGTYWSDLIAVDKPNLDHLITSKKHNFKNTKSYLVKAVRKIAIDNSKNIWLATEKGILEKKNGTAEFINHSELYDTLNTFSSFYRTVFVDYNQTIWAGSNHGGLSSYKPSINQFKHYLNDPKNSKTISSNTVYSIYQDSNGYYWIGTGQGLDRFNQTTETFEHLGKGLELYYRSIFAVFPDNFGNFWLSSDKGIIKYNTKTNEATFFDQADGLQYNELFTTASFQSPSGEIFLGGTKGVVSFFPSKIIPNTISAKPVITNFLIHNIVISPDDSLHGRVILNKQVWETNKIDLRHNEADFTFEFSSLHFSAPEKNKFKYKLEGFNDEWAYTDANKRYASYTGLPPGDYTFVLKATNNDGLWCTENDTVRFQIYIAPAFWQTLLFKLIIGFLLALFCLILVLSRIKNLKIANQTLNKKVKERTLELETVNAFLEKNAVELEETNAILEDRQEEINQQKDEIQSQYQSLVEQQQKIIDQNRELDFHRNKLEFLVEERTKELEKAMLKAELSDKLKTSFLTNMSHEIRTPMNAIIGFSSLLKGEPPLEKRSKYIDIIENNGKSLLTLINDILDLSSIQSQQISLKLRKNNLNNLLNKIYDVFALEIKSKPIELKLNTSLIDNGLSLSFDEVRLKQVISNLLSNALKFTKSGIIEFGISSLSKNITFYVKDTGIGISKEIGDSIFERFYKIEVDKTKLYRGTGLGLAICKSVVQLWDGKIWYESTLGIGTTFFFTLPITDQKFINVKTLEEQSSTCFDLEGKKILIVEDEESNYFLLESLLQPSKVEITWAKNGIEALDFLKNNEFNLVLMDIKMPEMNGIEASKIAKKLYPKLPVIAQTAFAYSDEINEIMDAGVDAYLVKPIIGNELFHLILKFI